MGTYLEAAPSVTVGKADWFLNNIPGTLELPGAPTDFRGNAREVTICVVQNGIFDAAAIVCSMNDLRRFNSPMDQRPKRWLTMPTEELLAHQPDLAERINVRVSGA